MATGLVGSTRDLRAGGQAEGLHAFVGVEIDLVKLAVLYDPSLVMESRLHAPGPPGRLRGRTSECALLDELVSAIRRGESRSLVLRGEAGIGKTALLEYLVASASDLTVLRAVGVESEMELAYASLHQLCVPLLRLARDASRPAARTRWRSCSG